VRGLTTAAGLWVVASLGVAVGAGFYLAAGVGGFLAIATITILKIIENKYINIKTNTRITFQAKNSAGKLSEILNEIGMLSGKISDMNFEYSDDKWMNIMITIDRIKDNDITVLAQKLDEIKGIKDIRIENK
jgi:putative Mg2+ transporter-C (MgtC) family protein